MLKTVKKIIGFSVKVACLLLSCLTAACVFPVAAHAQASFISDITAAAGEDGRATLESNGYTVLFQGMNIVTTDGDPVFLGYKKGTDAVTDLIVSSKSADSLECGGCTYLRASDISLNAGTDGTPLYLYFTRDASAGSGIVSLDTVSGFSDKDEVISLKNDGSSPVRTDGGEIANLDDGIENCELYLLMYRSGEIKRYISEVYTVSGSTKAEAINSAASKGCDYWLSDGITADGVTSYIAFRRTADKNDAITKLTFNKAEPQTEKNADSDTYLLDISSQKLFGNTFELGSWAGVYLSYDKTVSKTSDEYKTLRGSKEICSCVSAGSSGIYTLYLGKSASNETDGVTDTDESAAAENTAAAADGAKSVTDEYFGIDKSETSENTTDNAVDGDRTATAFGKGSSIAIAVLALIIVLSAAAAALCKKKKTAETKKSRHSDGK